MSGGEVDDGSKLALRAVLFADAVEYSRLVHEDESAALDLMRSSFQLFRGLAAEHDGALVKTTGDGAVLVFASAIAAVNCAIAVQHELKALNRPLPDRQRAPFRIGIHLGEVLYEDGDIYGHIVNVAARLQGLAEPGGICVSGAIYNQARHKLNLVYRTLGRQHLKNMAESVSVYQISESGDPTAEPSPNAGRVEVSVLGGFALGSTEGQMADIRSKRLCALMGYLALKDHNFEFRDRLAGLLQDDQSNQSARKSLTSGLRRLKQSLDKISPELLVFDQQIVRLQTDAMSIDLIEISQQLSENTVSEVLVDGKVAPESILSGLDNVGSAFTSWLKVVRHSWRNKLIRLLESYIIDPSEVSELQTRAAIALQAMDATHELACRCLMENHAESGNAAAALRIYGQLKQCLAMEFEIEPSEETNRLAEEIRHGRLNSHVRDSATATANQSTSARLPRILVRQLKAQDDAGPAMHLFDGFRQELIASLVRFREWVVIEERSGATASSDDQGGYDDTVDYFIEVSCAKYHSEFYVTVAFVHSAGGRYLWSERYMLTLESWARSQSDIVRQIAGGMGIYLSTERIMTRSGGGDMSLEAYDKWLQGEHLLTMWSPVSEREAEALFSQVIDEMPTFAPAYSSLSGIYNVAHLINVGKLRDPELEKRAAALAQKAVDIDPLDARTHLTLAWSFAMASRFGQAELHYDLAIQLNPNNPATLLSCAQGLAFAGKHELADAAAKDALKLAPVLSDWQWAYLATARFIWGDLEGCVEASEMAGDVIVDVPGWKAAALVLLGRRDEARLAGQQLLTGIRQAWRGNPNADDNDMIDWMLQAYPIKEVDVLNTLKDALDLALSERKLN